LLDRSDAFTKEGDRISHLFDDLCRHSCLGGPVKVFRLGSSQVCPASFKLGRFVCKSARLHHLQSLLQQLTELLVHLRCDSCVKVTTLSESFHINLTRVWMLGDDVVQLRLGKLRLIRFVVTVASVAYHVYEDVLAEFLTE